MPPTENHDRLRWTKFRPSIAQWIKINLELSPPIRGSSRLPEMVVVCGWKELKTQASLLTVASSRNLLSPHHIVIPGGKVTAQQIVQAINLWLQKTFQREWQIERSGIQESLFRHGPADPFEPDSVDPSDSLNWLDPWQKPHFNSGICEVKGCSYLAFAHTSCHVCCKRKYSVEDQRATARVGAVCYG